MHGCGGNQDGALIESLGCIAAGDRETVPEAECKNAVIRMPKGEPGRKKAVRVLLFCIQRLRPIWDGCLSAGLKKIRANGGTMIGRRENQPAGHE